MSSRLPRVLHRNPSGRTRGSRLALSLGAALVMSVCPLLATATPALADHGQTSIVESDSELLADPAGTLRTIVELGISTVRLTIRWQSLAPSTNSFRAPRHFDAANPAAYPSSRWAPYDALVRAAAQDGVRIDLDLSGGAPMWATGPGMPHKRGHLFHNWKPSAAKFGQFARAVAIRYSGNYSPSLRRLAPEAADDLPRVSFWSVLNEPNYGPNLAPQALPGRQAIPSSPRQYRALLDQAWSALHATGHGSDTLLVGELAPRGVLSPGKFSMTAPLAFLRSLYCLGGSYRPLRGRLATLEGCPTSARGSRAFARRNPALFRSSGVSDHPYMRWFPPNRELNQAQPKGFRRLRPDYGSLGLIGHFERGVDRMLRAYGWQRKLPVWITEFGYITNPPARFSSRNPFHYPSPTTAAYYDNWAEYIAWRDPRIVSFDQYLLWDPYEPRNSEQQGFPSGLIFADGQHKPGFDAFRMPLYLPRTTASGPTQTLEVWGAARPAYFTELEQPGTPQSVTILFRGAGQSQFTPLSAVPISSPEGYFDTRVAFPSSGVVKLAWTYPNGSLPLAGQTVYSRVQQVTVR